MQIGIIGAENSHTVHIAKEINVNNNVPGFSVDYVWGETDELAKKAAADGNIPTIVSDPKEMLGKIDAVIVDHRHPKYHLDAVRPFTEQGVPTFVDKPFCYDSTKGAEFLKMAREKGTPVTSFSVLSHQQTFHQFTDEMKALGAIAAGTTYGPCDLYSEHGGVFFYGIHQVDMALHAFGYDVERVQVAKADDGHAVGLLFYASGTMVSMHFVKAGVKGFAIGAAGSDGYLHKAITMDEHPYLTGIKTFTDMFTTGKEPVSHEDILAPIKVLEALDRSLKTGAAENVK
jgi:predicted dehydrogenase